MQDKVKYQLEKAESALREALSLGGSKEDPYLLRHIAETLSSINSWHNVFGQQSPRYNLNKTRVGDSIRFDMGVVGGMDHTSGMDEMPVSYYGAAGDRVVGGAGNDVISF